MIQMKLVRLLKPVGMTRNFAFFPEQAHSFQLRLKYSAASLAPDQIMTKNEVINGFFPANGHSKKASLKSSNGKAMLLTQEELASLHQDFKKMTEEIQTKVSTHQVAFIKELDDLTLKSTTQIKSITKTGRLEELSLVSKQIKETHTKIIQTLEKSKATSLKEIQEMLGTKEEQKAEQKAEQNAKNKNPNERFKSKFMRVAFNSIKKQSVELLLKEKNEIDAILKRSWYTYFERVKLNKMQDRAWFEEKFVDETYGKDLVAVKKLVEDSGADFYLKLNDLILMANQKFQKKEM